MSGSPSFARLRNKEAKGIGLSLLAGMGWSAHFSVSVAQPETRENLAIPGGPCRDHPEITAKIGRAAGLRNSDTSRDAEPGSLRPASF
ncbi:MAG TPA: hypothetical protein VH853_00030 [Polyangia bacterium]|jgi:hypothetical protein|nr:hypothetical protein [Polyangia bacterium]